LSRSEAEEEPLPFVTFFYVREGAEIIAWAFTKMTGWQKGVFYCPFCDYKSDELPLPTAAARGREHILSHITDRRRMLILRHR